MEASQVRVGEAVETPHYYTDLLKFRRKGGTEGGEIERIGGLGTENSYPLLLGGIRWSPRQSQGRKDRYLPGGVHI